MLGGPSGPPSLIKGFAAHQRTAIPLSLQVPLELITVTNAELEAAAGKLSPFLQLNLTYRGTNPPPPFAERSETQMKSDSIINADHVLPANIETKSILLPVT